jgi:hypothetical protein
VEPHGGQVVAKFFDVGQSRSVPGERRPEAARSLAEEDHPLRYCALLNMADLFERSGRHAESAEFYRQAWRAAEPPECSVVRGFVHVGLGRVARRLADPVTAEWHHRTALDIAEHSANRTLECAARLDLGDLPRICGRLGEAGEVLERALAVARNAAERTARPQTARRDPPRPGPDIIGPPVGPRAGFPRVIHADTRRGTTGVTDDYRHLPVCRYRPGHPAPPSHSVQPGNINPADCGSPN